MSPRAPGSAARRSLVFLLALPLAACRGGADDPALTTLAKALAPGERLEQMRRLGRGPEIPIAAVVRDAEGAEELRIYDREKEGPYRLRHRSRHGESLRNLELEDVTGDGLEEILATWAGGHLEILEIVERGPDGACRTILEAGGSMIERGPGPEGGIEIRVTGRTYEEKAGQPPLYESTTFRYDGDRFVTAPPF